MTRSLAAIKADLRATRKEMRAKGIKRIACFNGGIHGEVYSLNARMFALETEQADAVKGVQLLVMASDGTTCWGNTYVEAVAKAMLHDKLQQS